MAIALAAAAVVRPLEGAIKRRFDVGTGGVTAGSVVCMGTDGVVMEDGSASNNRRPLGIAIKTELVGGKVAVVTHGAIACVTGAAEGSDVYALDGTPGTPSHTASTKKWSVGIAESASVVFVSPIYIA